MSTKSAPASHESKQADLLSGAATQAPAVVPTRSLSTALSGLLPKIAELDRFAEGNNLAVLTEGKGQFESAIMVADAIGQLKTMLTPEIMKPIMELQGTTLGFKTDKDKEGGYPPEVVRDCFIEATLRGFQMVNNQTNIIGGRAYQTKEGFEAWLLKMGRTGKLTDFRDAYSVPKVTGEEAIVTASAGWVWNSKADKIENVQLSIRINKGQGSDAILGKAKRKLIARVYQRVTGTVITDGDASDAIDIQATPVTTAAAGQPGVPATGPAPASEEQKEKLGKLLADAELAKKANTFLLSQGAITEGQTFLNVNAKTADKIITKFNDFKAAIGA